MAFNYTTVMGPSVTNPVHENGRSMFVPTVAVLLLGLGLLWRYSKSNSKSDFEPKSQWKEPPSLTSPIPFVGHLIGMLKYQVGYMQMLR